MTDYYKKNLTEITLRWPDFAQFIEKSEDIGWIEEMKAENNDVNVLLRTESEPYLIYDNKNPRKEAENESYENMDNESVSIFVGIGAGYHIAEALENMSDRHVVLVVDPIFQFIKIALRLNDFSDYIKKGSLLFAMTREDIDYQISLIDHLKNVKQWFIPVENYTKKKAFEYRDITQHVFFVITQVRNNTSTIMHAGALMASNDISSLPYIIRHRGVSELKDLFKDKPAILVSTGPSLQKNIHLLMPKEVQDRFIIIAVGQAYRVLKAYDIRPDFICSVDFGPVNWGHYKGLFENDDVPLVAINRTYQPILKHWKGPKFISISLDSVTTESIAEVLQEKGGLLQGGSVSHMCFGLAVNMGCNPIVFIGQDLGWEDDDNSHINLVDEGGKVKMAKDGTAQWEVLDPRSEIKGSHQVGAVQKVIGYYGKPISTMSGYISFISTFERMFRELTQFEIINATEGGAKLIGTVQKTLQEVIEKYAHYYKKNGIKIINDNGYIVPIDKSVLKPFLSFVSNQDKLIEKCLEALKNDLKNLDVIIKHCNKAIFYQQKLKGKQTNKQKMAKRLEINRRHTLAAKKLTENNPLMTMSVFWAGKKIQEDVYQEARKDMKQNLKKVKDIDYLYTKEGKQAFIIRNKANEKVMKATREAAENLKPLYEETIDEMEYLLENKELKSFENMNPAPSLADAESYLEKGNWAFPLNEARRLLYINQNIKEDWELEAYAVQLKCLEIREQTIKKAMENYNREGKDRIIKYNHYMSLAHKEGQNQQGMEPKERNFEKALEYLEKAVEYDPDRIEAQWGLATTYHGMGDLEYSKYKSKGYKHHLKNSNDWQKKSIKTYKELIKESPDNTRFKFELALVLLRTGKGREADLLFQEIFNETNEYDYFLKGLSKLYKSAGMTEEAATAMKYYKEKYPFDMD